MQRRRIEKVPAPEVLLLCYGNPAREDDGIGPELADRLERLSLGGVQIESNYQLMVEDAAQIAAADVVVFVDATLSGAEPYSFERVAPRTESSYMSHSIGPERLLGLTGELFGTVPESYLLAVRGYSFEMFTEGLTDRAAGNVRAAAEFLVSFVASKNDQGPASRSASTGEVAGASDRKAAGGNSTGG